MASRASLLFGSIFNTASYWAADSFRQPFCRQNSGKVDAHFDALGLDIDGLLEVLDGLDELASAGHNQAQLVVGSRIAGGNVGGRPKDFSRLVATTASLQGSTKVIPDFGVVAIDLQRLLEQ